MVKDIRTDSATFGLAISGTKLYATGVGVVYVIDTITDTIHFPEDTESISYPALTTDGVFLYVPVANRGLDSGTMVVINTKTKAVVGEPITGGLEAVQVAVEADDIFAYVSDSFSETVTVLRVRDTD